MKFLFIRLRCYKNLTANDITLGRATQAIRAVVARRNKIKDAKETDVPKKQPQQTLRIL